MVEEWVFFLIPRRDWVSSTQPRSYKDALQSHPHLQTPPHSRELSAQTPVRMASSTSAFPCSRAALPWYELILRF